MERKQCPSKTFAYFIYLQHWWFQSHRGLRGDSSISLIPVGLHCWQGVADKDSFSAPDTKGVFDIDAWYKVGYNASFRFETCPGYLCVQGPLENNRHCLTVNTPVAMGTPEYGYQEDCTGLGETYQRRTCNITWRTRNSPNCSLAYTLQYRAKYTFYSYANTVTSIFTFRINFKLKSSLYLETKNQKYHSR